MYYKLKESLSTIPFNKMVYPLSLSLSSTLPLLYQEGGQYGHFTRCEHFWIFWVKVARGGRQFYIFLLISNLNNYYIINFC